MGPIAGGVTVAEDTTGVTVTFVGDLDLAGGQKLRAGALPLLDRDQGGEFTLDLAGVEFCDSAGIAALVELRKRCTEQGWHMRTIGLQSGVRRVVVDFGGLGPHLNVIDE